MPISNRLNRSTSPYLRQHADNPVHWQPWDQQALELARRENRPILLSIGYAACHWCHVMAHESFEDEATAGLMNRWFVNIKVDREQRPDLDKIYQTAHQLLSQRPGGWPLTVFLDPQDHTPFFAGTYFPPEPRYGMPSFQQLLESVHRAYSDQHAALQQQNHSLRQALESLNRPADEAAPDDALLQQAARQLEQSFDPRHGGFGQAPKFPHSGDLIRLLRHWRESGEENPRWRHMVEHSLTRMALGGVNDALAGGFFRYSVDERWEIPHFEKMLYDNALLLDLYSEAWEATGNPLFRHTALKTADWMLNEMIHPEGGLYSSLDADSEGEEGRFYLWTPQQVEALLEPEQFALLSRLYGLDREANFEGRWHLHCAGETLPLEGEAGRQREQACQRLLQERSRRIRPGLDDKILTAWNALAIRALANASRRLQEPRLGEAAERALTFINRNLYREDRLLASWRDGIAEHPAYLDDHAFLLDALLSLLQLEWSEEKLQQAQALAECLLEQFEDCDQGSFWFTAHDHEALIYRPKSLSDDALPSGNGVAALALNRLGLLLGEPGLCDAARRCLQAAAGPMADYPQAHSALLEALREQLEPPQLLKLQVSAEQLPPWREVINSNYRPHLLCLFQPAGESGAPQALLCRGQQCEPPMQSPQQLASALQERETRHGG